MRQGQTRGDQGHLAMRRRHDKETRSLPRARHRRVHHHSFGPTDHPPVKPITEHDVNAPARKSGMTLQTIPPGSR